MREKKEVEEPEGESEGSNRVLEHIGIVKGEKWDITVDVAAYVDPKGTSYPPSVRLNRLAEKKGEKKIKALGSLKSVAEVEGLVKLLPKAAKALEKALK